MSDERLRALERSAQTGGLLERLALDAEILRRSGPVAYDGPPTAFATLALYLGRQVDPTRCGCGHAPDEHRGGFGGTVPGNECSRCSCLAVAFDYEPERRVDPRADPAFRALLADAGEWETLVAWAVTVARRVSEPRRVRPREGYWTYHATRIADALDRATRDWPPKWRKRAFRDGYPFGRRSGWAYTAWRKAVAALEGRTIATVRRKRAPDKTLGMFDRI